MSEFRRQALIEAPLADVWDLVGDPSRYPEWWPRVIEVQSGEQVVEGSEYVQTTRTPLGKAESTFLVDDLQELRQIRMHCTLSGTFAEWRLTEAQDGTFVDVQLGMDPTNARFRVLDATVGRRFNRRWLDESVKALQRAARPAS